MSIFSLIWPQVVFSGVAAHTKLLVWLHKLKLLRSYELKYKKIKQKLHPPTSFFKNKTQGSNAHL